MSEESSRTPPHPWMSKPVIILGLALFAMFIYGVAATNQKNAAIAELKSVRSQLFSAQSELYSTKYILTPGCH